MKKRMFLAAIAFLITNVSLANDITGRWSGIIAGQYEITVNMKEDNGKITGTILSQIGEIPLSGGTITGNDILFKDFSYNGIAVTYIKGKLDGDKMNITVGFQGQDFQGTLTRVSASENLPQ
jgi:hypothetical protein